MLAIEALNEIELTALPRGRQVQVFQERYFGLRDRNIGASDRSALVGRGQKCVRVILHTAVSSERTDRDEARQILVFRAQSVSDPGANGWTDQIGSAGMH